VAEAGGDEGFTREIRGLTAMSLPSGPTTVRLASRLVIARDAGQTASERTDDATVHEQRHSVAQALDGLSGEADLNDDIEVGDRLEQLEHQFVRLDEQTDGVVARQPSVARDSLDRFRQERPPDLESGTQ